MRILLCLTLLSVASLVAVQGQNGALNPPTQQTGASVSGSGSGSSAGIDVAGALATFKQNAKCKFPLMTILDVSGSMTAVMSNSSKQEAANLRACLSNSQSSFVEGETFIPGAWKSSTQLTGTCSTTAKGLYAAWKSSPTAEKTDAFLREILPTTYAIYRRRIDGLRQMASLLIQIMQFQGNGSLVTFSSETVEVLDAAVFQNLDAAGVDNLVKAKVCPDRNFLKLEGVQMKLPICTGATNYAAALYNASRWTSAQTRSPNFAFGSIIFVTDGSPSSGLTGNTDTELLNKFQNLKNRSMHITTVSVITPDTDQRARLQSYASLNTDLNSARQTPAFVEAANWDWSAVSSQILRQATKLCFPIYTHYFENDEASECDPLCAVRDPAGKCPPEVKECTPAPERFGGANRSPFFNTNSPKGCAVNADSRCARRVDIIKRNLGLIDSCGADVTKYVLCYASNTGAKAANNVLSQRRGAFIVKALTGQENAPKWVAVGGGVADNAPSDTAKDIYKRFCAVSCGCVPKEYRKGAAASAPLCPE